MQSLTEVKNGISTSGKGLQGARIGIIAKPSVEFVAGIFATWLSGGVAVPLAISYPESELLHVMNDSVRNYYNLFYCFSCKD